MENQKQTTKKGIKKSRGVNASIVILICLILAVLFFRYVLGNTSNFEDDNIDNHPLNPKASVGALLMPSPTIMTLPPRSLSFYSVAEGIVYGVLAYVILNRHLLNPITGRGQP